jgi:Protein of unknown function (DUF4238)
MAGARQHFLPAAAIGRFSSETETDAYRDRPVWVRRRDGTVRRQAASTLAFQRNLYSIGTLQMWGMDKRLGADPDAKWDMDSYWTYAENSIGCSLDQMLADGPGLYQANPWCAVAWYLSSLFARSPDFHRQLRQRFDHWDESFRDKYVTYEGTNALRIMENQRVMPAIVRANWTVLIADSTPLILNDRGMTAMWDPRDQTTGYVFPLKPSLAMALKRGPHKKLITWVDSAWRIDIPTARLDSAQARSLNASSWRQSRREVYSGDTAELDFLRDITPIPVEDQGKRDPFGYAALLGLTTKQRRAEEALGLNVVAGLKPPVDPARPQVFAI